MSFDENIFREYDVRGVFNQQFDVAFAKQLAKAYVTFTRKDLNKEKLKITVGYDARLSSPEIAKSVTEGLRESGADVLQLGLVTSPISYFSTFEVDGVDGAFMITGSHNPPEYNGFKISVGKRTIYGSEIQELKKILISEDFHSGSGTTDTYDIFPSYLERYKKEFGQLDDVKVVLDCGNGAAGCIVRELFDQLGLNPEILFEKPDGEFPNHHPDPTVEKNLVDLKNKVKETGASVGIGFDGDADRIGVVDHLGNMILGDELMMVYARDIVPNNPGCKVIGDVKCSDRMFHEIDRIGGKSIMWKTGHSLIKQKVKEEKAPFGGELSGHIFFADRNYGYDDALYAALRLVEIMAKTKKTIPELLDGIPSSFNTPEIRIDTTEEDKIRIVEELKQVYSGESTNLIDGLRVSFDDGWALARPSNTQPVLVLRFESTSQAGLEKMKSAMEKQIESIQTQ